ncbi:phage major capsid protein [Rhizobium laguerreae]|uniref:phage major capsid protein n=1 Tax=Rhizobium laguerreae TaxID=1076926 RepID=UPI001C902224|nr:phage major capsid protein [Rhizobium laguerreae]MBY3225261.1 phage major capsid protein [Rhizobium laguerreae]
MSAALKLEYKSESEDPIVEVKTALDALTTEVKAKADNDNKLVARIAELETKLARPNIITDKKSDEDITPERKAFTSFLRSGIERMPAEETKALVVSDDTRGGYLAPAEFQTEILKGIVEISPVRQAARVGSTGAGSVILPKRTGTPTASWVGETETRTGTESAYGQIEIPVWEMACYVDVSQQLLEDAAINVEGEVSSDLIEEFGRLESSAFVTGNGFKKPEGFMAVPGITEFVSGSASTIADADGQANGLIAAFYDLPAAYRARVVWGMNSTTLGSVRKLKDASKNYLWQPAIQAGEPSTLMGRPVIEMPDMPDEGAGTTPIILGDFNAAYRIYDRVGMSILRDPYTQATSGKVRFHARRRVGGATVMVEALRKIKCATS